MNMIPQSNGLYKLKNDKKIVKNKKSFCKLIITIFLVIISFGYIFQFFHDFIGNEKIESSLSYVKVDNKKIEYNYGGTGDYTVVFSGGIGTNLYQWDSIVDKLQKDVGVKTFVYNRSGYGFSEGDDMKSPKSQAEELKILLRKAGVSGNIILVGEEYGSLIMTNYASLYPESVQALLLINPYEEEEIKGDNYRRKIKKEYYKSKAEFLGTYVGLTTLFDKLNLTYEVKSFVENLEEVQKEEYNVKKNQKNYRKAIQNEFKALYEYSDTTQNEAMFENKPLYIISKKESEPLVSIGDPKYTTLYTTSNMEDIIATTDSQSIVDGVKVLVRESKKINKIKSEE